MEHLSIRDRINQMTALAETEGASRISPRHYQSLSSPLASPRRLQAVRRKPKPNNGVNWYNLKTLRLCPEQVQEIHRLRSKNWTFRQLAAHFNCSKETIGRVLKKTRFYSNPMTPQRPSPCLLDPKITGFLDLDPKLFSTDLELIDAAIASVLAKGYELNLRLGTGKIIYEFLKDDVVVSQASIQSSTSSQFKSQVFALAIAQCLSL